MATISRVRVRPSGDKKRVAVLGGGWGGIFAAMTLQDLLPASKFEVLLVSRDNFFVVTPLLFEAGSGVLEFRHAVSPIRELLTNARYYQGTVEGFDLADNSVRVRSAAGRDYSIGYDQLVIALGGVTNRHLIPGSEHALAFKVLGDAILLRNRVIDLLERAETEIDPATRARLLTIVVIGGGLVGVELVGELTEMLEKMRLDYPSIKREEIAVHLIEGGPRLLREMAEPLADYATRTLQERGVRVKLDTRVKEIRADSVILPDGTVIPCGMSILASGNRPNPVIAESGLELSPRGQIMTDGTMRAKGRDNVWALGDCAHIPDPSGQPYPPLAQHATREGRLVARNIAAHMTGKGAIRPFNYSNRGTLAALGHYKGIAQTPLFCATGFLAWWMWRSYYLLQMPRWSRRFRIMVDWTMALLFKPDTFKIDLGNRTPDGKSVPE